MSTAASPSRGCDGTDRASRRMVPTTGLMSFSTERRCSGRHKQSGSGDVLKPSIEKVAYTALVAFCDLRDLDLCDELGRRRLCLAFGALEATGDEPGMTILPSDEDPEAPTVVPTFFDVALHGGAFLGQVAQKLPITNKLASDGGTN